MPCQSKVAVLVATCNRPGLLAQRSLTAIQRQTRRPDFLVVVDDSDAPQRGDNRNIVNDLRLHGARIVYLTNTRTQGASGAWNTGLDWLRRHAGDPQSLFVAVLDDDDEWNPDHLRDCAAAADAQGLDMVAAGLVRITGDAPDRVQVPPAALEADLFLVGNPHIQGSNLFVRLSAFLEAGGFDESLLSCTDRDLCIRLADLGWVRYAALGNPTVRHHADAARPRLSSPTNDPKRRGLDRFWSKWHGRMSEAQRRTCSDRAKKYFGWSPPEAPEAPMFPVGPLVPSREPTDVEKAHADDLVLVVGAIADDGHVDQFARLLEDLLALQSFDQVCCLDVVVLLNGSATGSVTHAVSTFRERGLTVFLATEEQQAADAASGRFGAGFARPTGRAPIGPARTMLQAYVTRVASQRNGAIAWILDDDSRLDNLTDHSDAPAFATFLASLGRMRALGVDVVLGSITGDPPIPPGSTVRTQLVDLYHNLAWLAGLDAGAVLPDRRADNRAARAAARDYYYDLSRRDTHHLEWPFWLTPSQPGELVGSAFSRMIEALPRILAGQGVFRPLLLDSPYDAVTSMRPSVQRGTNTFVFDCAAFADFPNLAPRFAGDVLRRSDMIWALLNRYAGGRRLVSATLPIRHDRSSEPPVGLDLGRLVGDIRGYALYSALEDVLVRRRERRLRDGVGAETPDDLQFRDGDLDLAVARFRKYLVERTAALLWSCWRIRGICHALLDLAAGGTFKRAFFHSDPQWKDRLAALSEFLARTREQFDTQRVEQVVANVIDVPPEQVRDFLRSLRSAVASHRKATASTTDDEWFHAERVASAAPLARAAADGAELRLLGTGGEGVVFAAPGSAVKVIDYSKRSAANGAWQGMELLVAQHPQHGPLCRCSMPHVPGGRVVIRRPLEEGEQYRGGGASDILAILRALRQAGVVTTNFHPKNLLSTPSGVRLIDYGSDIRPLSEQGFRSMVQRAWLTLRFAERADLSQLMRRALEDEALPELEGWQALLASIDPPAKREVVDDAILDLVRQLCPRRVLDFGCGHGRLAAALASDGIEVVAFDPDGAMRDRWQKLSGSGGEKVRWLTGLAHDALAASPGAFDVVVCSLVLCVIEDQAEYEAAISALARSLAPGGRCVILVCNPESTLAGDSTLQRRLVPAGSAPEGTFTWTKELPSGVRRSDVHRPMRQVLLDLACQGLHADQSMTTGGLSLTSLLPSRDHLLVTASAVSHNGLVRSVRANRRIAPMRQPLEVPVLCYHRVLPVDYIDAVSAFQRMRGTVVELDVFRRQLDEITRYFTPVSLDQYVSWLDGHTTLPDAACLVTFDDGYRDFLEYALPLLKAKRIPATLFPTKRAAIGGGLLPVDSLYSALALAQNEGRISASECEEWSSGTRKREFIRATKNEQAALLRAAGLRPAEDIGAGLYLSEDELLGLPIDLVALGGHGVNHDLLDRRDLSFLRRELRRTRFWLEHLNHRRGGETLVLAYPNGSHDDLTVAAMVEADFDAAFTVVPCQRGRSAHRWALRRSCIPNRVNAIQDLADGKEVRL
jgi:SAM-dependent methyltransferase/GT2 family glycosyltransferase